MRCSSRCNCWSSTSGAIGSVDTADPQIGALMQRMQEKSTAIETKLLFFELEWAALDDDARVGLARRVYDQTVVALVADGSSAGRVGLVERPPVQ